MTGHGAEIFDVHNVDGGGEDAVVEDDDVNGDDDEGLLVFH